MQYKSALAAIPLMLGLSACGEEPPPVDTSFEKKLPAPVPVNDGPGPVPDNDIGTPRDDVQVDYGIDTGDGEAPGIEAE